MRPDGKPAKGLTPIMRAIPHIMPERYDAMNWTSTMLDEDSMKEYTREKWKAGTPVTHMSIIVAAYYKAVLENPKLNYFVMNRKIYERNHFCFSFVILKTRADGTPDETVIKIYLEPTDTIFTINEKTRKAIELNTKQEHNNNTDKFLNFAFAIPGLARGIIGLAKMLDKVGLLPKFIIDLSPFHTSMFITNLASINTQQIYHHCYEFGTTSVFLCMGRPEKSEVVSADGKAKKKMPLTVVMDERIATGIEYSKFFNAVLKYINNPTVLETRLDGKDE